MNIQTLNHCWREYRKAVYPETLPQVQEQECHQAFFAGAYNATLAMQQIGTLPEDEAMAALEKLYKEAETVCKLRAIVLNLRAASPAPPGNGN